MIGGTASELGGGKFANGAVTAAFARTYNDEQITKAQEERACKKLASNDCANGPNFFGSLERSVSHNLNVNIGLEAAYGPGAELLYSTNLNGDASYTFSYVKGVIVKPIGGISATALSTGTIRGFFQSVEFCAIGCLQIRWNYQDIALDFAIGPYGGAAFESGITGELHE